MDLHLINLETGESFEKKMYCYTENLSIHEISKIISVDEKNQGVNKLWILGLPVNVN